MHKWYNHSIIHKINKHWKSISIISLLAISALNYSTTAKASNSRPIHISYQRTNINTQRKTLFNNNKHLTNTNHNNPTHTSNNNPKQYSYITPDYSQHEYYFTNQDLNYMKNNTNANYINHIQNTKLKQRIFTKIYAKSVVARYHFDLVQFPKRHKNWVINTDLSHYKNHRHNDVMISDFFKRLYKQYLNKYYTHSQYNQILNNQNQFNTLRNKYNSTKDESSLHHLRNEEIKWLNFYRQNLFNENGLKENKTYDNIAQHGAKKSNDPEDMDYGSYTPHDSTFDYLTDANDIDNDGTTGHRYSILRPNSNQVGIGQYDDRNAVFMDWGLNNKINNVIPVNYPTSNIFPLEYAKDGEYWSYQINKKAPIKTVKVSVRDKTLNDKLIKTYDQHINNNIVYYKVNTNALKDHHLYKITIYLPHHNKSIYTVRLYNLVQKY